MCFYSFFQPYHDEFIQNPPPFINYKFSLTIFIDAIAIFINYQNMQYIYQHLAKILQSKIELHP